MAYTQHDPSKPAASQTGTQAVDSMRTNNAALRDMILAGLCWHGPQGAGTLMPGMTLAKSGGTAAQPAQWIYSRSSERIRVNLTWGSSGGSSGKITAVDIDYSSDSGANYDNVQTISITYDASGYVQSMACTAT